MKLIYVIIYIFFDLTVSEEMKEVKEFYNTEKEDRTKAEEEVKEVGIIGGGGGGGWSLITRIYSLFIHYNNILILALNEIVSS